MAVIVNGRSEFFAAHSFFLMWWENMFLAFQITVKKSDFFSEEDFAFFSVNAGKNHDLIGPPSIFDGW